MSSKNSVSIEKTWKNTHFQLRLPLAFTSYAHLVEPTANAVAVHFTGARNPFTVGRRRRHPSRRLRHLHPSNTSPGGSKPMHQPTNQPFPYMGVSPKHGWWKSWNILLKMGWFGENPIFGNTHTRLEEIRRKNPPGWLKDITIYVPCWKFSWKNRPANN